MDEFIARANAKHYKSMLETETDPLKRKIIQRLLADEEEKLAAAPKTAVSRSCCEPR